MMKKFIFVTALLLLSVTLISCKQDVSIKKTGSVSDKLKAEVVRDARDDMAVIAKVTSDPAGFQGALVGSALATFTKQVSDDSAKGQVKIRKYDKINIKINEAGKNLARGDLTFTDQSYYVDKKNPSQSLSLPQGKDKAYAVHLQKVDGKWKFAVIYAK